MKKLSSLFYTALFVILSCMFQVSIVSAKPVSLDEAVVQVKKTSSSKVLSAKEVTKDGEQFYLIKTINNGKVKLIRIDPETGKQY